MVYHTARILLAKPFLRRANFSSALSESDKEDTTTAGMSNMSKPERILEYSARQICATAKKYQRSFGSFRLSPVSATHCTLTAATVLLRLYPECCVQPKSRAMSDLQVCLDVLGELSTSWHTAYKLRQNLQNQISSRQAMHAAKRDDSSSPSLERNSDDSFNDPAPPVDLQGPVEASSEDPFPLPYNYITMSAAQGMENGADMFNSTWEQLGFGFMAESFPEDYNNQPNPPLF